MLCENRHKFSSLARFMRATLTKNNPVYETDMTGVILKEEQSFFNCFKLLYNVHVCNYFTHLCNSLSLDLID